MGKAPTPPRVILRTTKPTGGGRNVLVNVHVTVSPSARATATPFGRAGFGSGLEIVLWPVAVAQVTLTLASCPPAGGTSRKFQVDPASRTNVALPSAVGDATSLN